jgi:hypothetical protein
VDTGSSSRTGGAGDSVGPSSRTDGAVGSAGPSSSRVGGSTDPSSRGTGGFLGDTASSGAVSSRPRKRATSPPVQGEGKNPDRENNYGELWCKTAGEDSTDTKPCGR